MKTALHLLDVLAFLNRRHDGRVSRRPADAVFFERFDERRFRVTRRRLREMLLGRDRVQLQRLAFFDERRSAFGLVVVFWLLVAAFLVNLQKAVELLHRTRRAKNKTPSLNV